jgi:uncharacterized membrane protein
MNDTRNHSSSWEKYILAALAIAALSHLAIIHLVPCHRIDAAMDALSDGGMQFNQWARFERFAEPVAGAQAPNPDVMTAACVYDVAPGPVLITLGPWRDYWSLAFYDDQGEPYQTLSDREAPNRPRIVLMRRGAETPAIQMQGGQAQIVESPSGRGMVVLRRLAPSASSHAEAVRTAEADVCGNLEALNR